MFFFKKKNNIVPGPVSLSHFVQGVRAQNMRAHELLVGRMRLHNIQNLCLSAVARLGVFRNQPPGLMLGLFPSIVGSKFRREPMHSSAHTDPREAHLTIV